MTRTHSLPRHARCRVDVLVALSRLPGVDPVACAPWLSWAEGVDVDGGPIVDVAHLLQALPLWSHHEVREALARLEVELLVSDRGIKGWQRPRRSRIGDSWAVQLTAAGLAAARAVATPSSPSTPPRSPEVILAELRAVLAGASTEQLSRDLHALEDIADAVDAVVHEEALGDIEREAKHDERELVALLRGSDDKDGVA